MLTLLTIQLQENSQAIHSILKETKIHKKYGRVSSLYFPLLYPEYSTRFLLLLVAFRLVLDNLELTLSNSAYST